MGYHRAGFEVVGVDIKPQPHYPFEFHQADALEYPVDGFDVIHASPPCQAYSTTRTLHGVLYPDLVDQIRERMDRPYVLENVPGSPLRSLAMLCGSSFGLHVRRHRYFESSLPLMSLGCLHSADFVTVTGGGPSAIGYTRPPGGGLHRKPRTLGEARDAMGIDWMTRDELNEAIPPAYTEFIGEQLLSVLKVSA